jgi:hypothetical protein
MALNISMRACLNDARRSNVAWRLGGGSGGSGTSLARTALTAASGGRRRRKMKARANDEQR